MGRKRIRINRISRIIRIIRPITKKDLMQMVFHSIIPYSLYIHYLKSTSLIRIRIMPDGSNRIIRDSVKGLTRRKNCYITLRQCKLTQLTR